MALKNKQQSVEPYKNPTMGCSVQQPAKRFTTLQLARCILHVRRACSQAMFQKSRKEKAQTACEGHENKYVPGTDQYERRQADTCTALKCSVAT